MNAVIKKIGEDKYLSRIHHSDTGYEYEYTSNRNNALTYTSRGAARELAKYIENVEVVAIVGSKRK